MRTSVRDTFLASIFRPSLRASGLRGEVAALEGRLASDPRPGPGYVRGAACRAQRRMREFLSFVHTVFLVDCDCFGFKMTGTPINTAKSAQIIWKGY